MFDRSLKLVYQYVVAAGILFFTISAITITAALAILVWSLLWAPSVATAISVLSAVLPTCLVGPSLFVATWLFVLLCNFADPQRVNEATEEMATALDQMQRLRKQKKNPC